MRCIRVRGKVRKPGESQLACVTAKAKAANLRLMSDYYLHSVSIQMYPNV